MTRNFNLIRRFCKVKRYGILIVKWNPVNGFLHYDCGWWFVLSSPSYSTLLVWGYHIKQEATGGDLSIIHGKCEAHIYPAYTFTFIHPSCLLIYYVIIYVVINTKIVELVIQVLFFRTSSSTYLSKIGNSLVPPLFISGWLPGI